MSTKEKLDGLLDRIRTSRYEAVKITVVPTVLRELNLSGAATYRGVPIAVGRLERGDRWSIQLSDVVLSEGVGT